MIGNCLIGALLIRATLPGSRLTWQWSQKGVPHFVVVDRDGRRWHYRLVRDIVPWPFYWILFRGRFAREPLRPY